MNRFKFLIFSCLSMSILLSGCKKAYYLQFICRGPTNPFQVEKILDKDTGVSYTPIPSFLQTADQIEDLVSTAIPLDLLQKIPSYDEVVQKYPEQMRAFHMDCNAERRDRTDFASGIVTTGRPVNTPS